VRKSFEELDYRPTPIGALSLRRRIEPKTQREVFEIKLGEEFLMSSMFTASEEALANLALAHLSDENTENQNLEIVVGGLGLGYTARSVLQHNNVGSLVVVDALEAVIDWHESGVLPLGLELTNDPRCTFRQADFFALATSEDGFGKKLDAILVDIDHSPDFHLNEANAHFYRHDGLTKMARHLKPGGIFALWSDALPDDEFCERLSGVFNNAWVEPVTFFNPLMERDFTQSVYLAMGPYQA
jgi:spermidine synthase